MPSGLKLRVGRLTRRLRVMFRDTSRAGVTASYDHDLAACVSASWDYSSRNSLSRFAGRACQPLLLPCNSQAGLPRGAIMDFTVFASGTFLELGSQTVSLASVHLACLHRRPGFCSAVGVVSSKLSFSLGSSPPFVFHLSAQCRASTRQLLNWLERFLASHYLRDPLLQTHPIIINL